MTVVGSAEVVIRANTENFRKDLQAGFDKAAPAAEKEGEKTAKSFSKGFSQGSGDSRLGIDRFIPRDFAQRAEGARVAFRNLNRAFTIAFPAIVGVGGAIGALGGGLVTLGALAGNAAKSVGIVLVAGLGALGQAAFAAVVALKGVGEAINASGQSGGGTRAEEDALKRLRDARISLRNLIEREKPEELAAAQERAADAADAAADAVRNAEASERSYFQAQKATLDALEGLNEAREEAKEKIQQLRFALEGSAISEKRARIEFEKARDSLQRVQDLPPNSRARQEAELAFAEADLNLRTAIDRNNDLRKEEQSATRAGVEGSEEVISAKERLASAQQSEADAAIDAAKAFRDAARAQSDAAKAAAAAQAGGSVERELDERIARAREAVEEAERALADAASGGVNKFAEALAKLSPAAQRFVITIVKNKQAFNDFKKTVQEPFFQEFNMSLFLLLTRLPALGKLLSNTSRIVGRLASGFVDLFLGAENFGRTERIFKTNDRLIARLGKTFLNLVDGLLLLLDAAEPVIDAFGRWALQSSSGWLANLKGDFDGVRDSIEQSAEKAARLFGIFGTLKDIFGVLGEEINETGGASDILLSWLEKITNTGLADLQTMADNGSLKQFFIDATESAILVLEIIGNIIMGLLTLGAQPGTKQFLDSLNETTSGFSAFATEFGTENGPLASIGRFIESFFATFGALLQNESFTVFLDTLSDALDKVKIFLDENEKFFAAIAPVLAYVLALGFIFSTLQSLFFVFAGFFIFIYKGFQGVGKYLGPIIEKAGGMGAVFSRVLGVVKLLMGPLGWIIAGIALMWSNSQMFRDSIMASFGALKDLFVNTFESLKPVFSEIGEGLDGVFSFLGLVGRIAGDILSFVVPAITLVIGIVVGFIAGLIESIGGLVSIFTNTFGFIANMIQAFFGIFVGIFTGNFDMFIEKTNAAGENFKNIFKGVARVILGIFRGIVNGFVDAWNGLASRLKFKLPDWLGGWSISIPQIPRIPDLLANLAMGGIVPATSGGMLARIGEAGRAERVEPLDSSGLSKRDRAIISMLAGNGPAINVYPAPGMNETELARRVSREMAMQMRRGGV